MGLMGVWAMRVWTFCGLLWIFGIAYGLQDQKLEATFDGVPLRTALQMLSKQAGVNIVIDAPDELKVTAQLKAVTFQDALELLLKPNGLGYKQMNGTYIVGKAEMLASFGSSDTPSTAVLTQYHVRFVSSNALMERLRTLHPNLVILPGVPPDNPTLSGEGSSGTGGGGSSYSPPTPASGSDSGASGGSGGVSVSTDSSTIDARTILLYGSEERVQAALKTAQQLDNAPTLIRIVVIVTDLSHNSLKELGMTWDWSTFGLQEPVRPSDTALVENDSLLIPSRRGEFWRTPNSVQATLKAMEQRGQAKLLANPSVSVLNGETAQVLIGDRVLYPIVVGTTTAGTPLYDVQEQNVGIVLQVRAIAEPEGTITLDIYPQVSVVTGFLRIGDSSYPQISTRELRTKIRVKDGEQIALGGLIREEEARSIQEVPLLSKIPILGELFKFRRKSSTKSELVIFLRPEVIKEQ